MLKGEMNLETEKKTSATWRAAVAFLMVGAIVVAATASKERLFGANAMPNAREASIGKNAILKQPLVVGDSLGLTKVVSVSTYQAMKAAVESHGCPNMFMIGFSDQRTWLWPGEKCEVTATSATIFTGPSAPVRMRSYTIHSNGQHAVKAYWTNNPVGATLNEYVPSDAGYSVPSLWKFVYYSSSNFPQAHPITTSLFQVVGAAPSNPMSTTNGICPKLAIVAPNGATVSASVAEQCKWNLDGTPNLCSSIRLQNGNLIHFALLFNPHSGALTLCKGLEFVAGSASVPPAHLAGPGSNFNFGTIGLPHLGQVPCELSSFRAVY